MADAVFKICELFVSIIGGGGLVAWLWTKRHDRLEQYRVLDASYCALLKMYVEHPDFGDPAKIAEYVKERSGAWQYHYFAMTVHAFTETLFDTYQERIATHPEWGNIFRHHATLHWAWLEANPSAQEDRYFDFVQKKMVSARPARRSRAAA